MESLEETERMNRMHQQSENEHCAGDNRSNGHAHWVYRVLVRIVSHAPMPLQLTFVHPKVWFTDFVIICLCTSFAALLFAFEAIGLSLHLIPSLFNMLLHIVCLVDILWLCRCVCVDTKCLQWFHRWTVSNLNNNYIVHSLFDKERMNAGLVILVYRAKRNRTRKRRRTERERRSWKKEVKGREEA